MTLVLSVAILVNIMAILTLSFGLFFINRENVSVKFKANYGVFLGLVMFCYLILLALVAISGIIKHGFLAELLIIFIIAPFIIGKCSSFEKMVRYTVIQLLCFIMSFMILVMIFN